MMLYSVAYKNQFKFYAILHINYYHNFNLLWEKLFVIRLKLRFSISGSSEDIWSIFLIIVLFVKPIKLKIHMILNFNSSKYASKGGLL